MGLREALASKRVIVCCGSGGVGKTTTSAALAIAAAIEGKKAVVITIDPAKRLATSLGLKGLSPTATDLTAVVDRERVSQSETPLKGRFFAVMPDTTQTFENFVRSMAGKDQGLAKRVLKTSIYKIFAKEFSGTNEYMAMEKLYELYNEKSYDLIVLDTPPSANTKVFLEAPQMLADFFDDKIIRWFISPGSKLMATGLKKVMELLEKLTGKGFISELIEFATALFDLRAQFIDNLESVANLLHQDDVTFLMVTSPERLSKGDTQEFVNLLRERNYNFWGFVVNRVLGRRIRLESQRAYKLQDLLTEIDAKSPATCRILEENFRTLEGTLAHEREASQYLASLGGHTAQVALVAEQRSDVHSINALLSVSKELV